MRTSVYTITWIAINIVSITTAHAAVKAVATLPDIAWAMREIGKDQVDVKALLKGNENPHFADAVPEFIRVTANADILCQVGLELEVGWLPKVLARSGNAQVQSGGKGFCDLGSAVPVLDKPTGPIDRSMGDVHPAGNPHFWLSPKAFAQASSAIANSLSQVDPEHAKLYEGAQKEFSQKLLTALKKNKLKLDPVLAKHPGPVVLEYHKEFTYFMDAYGMKSFGTLEEKPGVPPSAGRIAEVASKAKAAGVKILLAADYNPRNVLERFSELSGIPVLQVQTSTQPLGKIKDYEELQTHIVDSIIRVLSANSIASHSP